MPKPASKRFGGGRSFARELAAIQTVLQRYEQAYDQLDAAAVAAVWPSPDARALARVFARLKRQDLTFDDLRVRRLPMRGNRTVC